MSRSLVLAVLVMACARASTEARPAPETKPSQTVTEPRLVTSLFGHVGERVAVDVRRTTLVSQHMGTNIDGKVMFEVAPLAGGGAIVTYVRERPACTGAMRLFGKVIEIRGGGKGHKSEQVYTETQLDVDAHRCL